MGFIHDNVAKAGFEVEEFTQDDAGQAATGKFARFTFGYAVFSKARKAALAGTPYAIINVHEPDAAIVIAFKKLCGNPIIVTTSHGVELRSWLLSLEEKKLGRGGPSWKTQILHPLTLLTQANFALTKADHVFCLNEEDKSFIAERFKRELSTITRIYPAADITYHLGAENRDYTRFRRLLFSGTWRKNKGIQDLVPAFEKLATTDAHLELCVLGAGFPEEAVREQFSVEVRERVKVVQTHNEAENVAQYANADALILPSLFEGTPLVLMEAMMSGLPIIATETCGMRDVIQHRENGLLIPIRSPEHIVESVQLLQNNEPLRRSLGMAASDVTQEKYTWDLVAKYAINAYRKMLSTNTTNTNASAP